MTDLERKEIELEHAWATKFFIKSFIERKNKEKEIIDDLYNIYDFYPEYFRISEIYEDIEHEKVVKNVHKAKQTLKTALVSGMGLCVAELAGLNVEIHSILAALGATVGGSIALYQLNKDDMGITGYSKREQQNILRDFHDKCDKFTNILSNYIFNVQEYVIVYDREENIDWISNLDRIFFENKEYIESKKEEKLFDSNFNRENAIKLHNQIFNIDQFNDSLLKARKKYNSKKSANEVRKR